MLFESSITSQLYSRIAEDTRVTVWHIGLYTSMLILWSQSGFSEQVKVSREKLMTLAHFRSITTYHKCIRQLQDFGYIVYLPTYDCYAGSVIEIIQE
ncbi:hypothetical protein BH09BAC6_BH09BAC6_13780 [soil metagenome]